jgi:hypothetical protein
MDAGDAGPERAGVGGSTPSLATIIPNNLAAESRNLQTRSDPRFGGFHIERASMFALIAACFPAGVRFCSVEAGWPSAKQLSFGLDEISR